MVGTKKKKSSSGASRLFLIFGLLTAAVFLPTTALLVVGMAPTPFAFLADRTKKKNKVLTVGAMNLAGCSPFVFELWLGGHDFAKTVEIVSNVQAIVVMWTAAAIGYLINWSMTGIVSGFMYQRGLNREKAIVKRQQELIDRWGREVTGEIPLDQEGFPIYVNKPAPAQNKSVVRKAR